MASVTGSLADYLVTVLLVQLFDSPVLMSAITGTVTGGIINFQMGRHWVFQRQQVQRRKQVKRYFVVWIGNLILNTSGFYFLEKYFVDYIAAKLIISVLVAVLYNYPLQKSYVFEHKKTIIQ